MPAVVIWADLTNVFRGLGTSYESRCPKQDVGHCWQEVGFHPADPSGWGWEVKATAGPQAGSRLGRACCPHSPTAGLGRQLCLAVPRSLRSTSETWPEVSLSRPKLKGESNLWGPERPRGLCTTCLLHVVQSGNRASPGLESPRCSHPQGPFV